MSSKIAYSHFEKEFLKEMISDTYEQFEAGKFDLRLFNNGFNVIYHLWTSKGGSYMFRIRPNYKYYNIDNESVNFVLEYQEYLRSQSFPVPRVLKTIEGEYFGIIDAPEGPRYFSVHEVVGGSSKFPLDEKQSYELGRYLATMHLLGKSYKPNHNRLYFTFRQMIEEPKKLLHQYPEAFSDNNEWFDDTMSKIGESLKSEKLDDLVIIHGDFWHGNVLINEKHDRINFIDFDFACYAPKEFDLASFLILGYQRYISNPEKFPKVDKMFSDLVKGYEEVWDATIDLKLVYLIAMARTCWMIGGYFTVIGIQSFSAIQSKIEDLTSIFKRIIKLTTNRN